MKQSAQLRYQTETVDMTTTILESMFLNMKDKISNMGVRLQFNNQAQKQAFLISEQRIKQQSDAVSLCSDESDEKGEKPGQSQKQKNIAIRSKDKKAKVPLYQVRIVQVPFEISILLKEKYSKKLQGIGNRLHVEFFVVPKKVKIIGMKSDLLDEALVEFGKLHNQINLVSVQKYAKQIFQSKYYKGLLKEKHVQIIKILDKYHFWFQECNSNINDLFKQIRETKHKIYHLGKTNNFEQREKDTQAIKLAHGSFSWLNNKKNMLNDLTKKIEATLFQKYIQNKLNKIQSRTQRKVQLSQDREGLILHLDAEQQIMIQEHNIRAEYELFQYVFMMFSPTINSELLEQFLSSYKSTSNGDKFRKKKSQDQKLFFIERQEDLVVIAYFQEKKTQPQKIQAQIQTHQLIQFFKKMPQELFNFKLILKNIMNISEEGELKKFSLKSNFIEKLTIVAPKGQKRRHYQQMIQYLIENKFVPSKQKKQQSVIKLDGQTSVSIDLSRPVDQSSIMLNNTGNMSYSMQNGAYANQSNSNILPQQLTATQPTVFRFADYNLCLPQNPDQREKRYSDQFVTVAKTSSTLKNDIEKTLNGATASKYKIWGLNLPLKYKDISLRDSADALVSAHPELQKYNRQVTVFYGGKELKDFEHVYAEDKKLKVYKIEERSKGKEDIKIKQGYVLKTNVVFLYLQFMENNGVTELPFGRYEALYYVKKLQS